MGFFLVDTCDSLEQPRLPAEEFADLLAARLQEHLEVH